MYPPILDAPRETPLEVAGWDRPALVDEDLAGWLRQFRWFGKVDPRTGRRLVPTTSVNGTKVSLARLIAGCPVGLDVTHGTSREDFDFMRWHLALEHTNRFRPRNARKMYGRDIYLMDADRALEMTRMEGLETQRYYLDRLVKAGVFREAQDVPWPEYREHFDLDHLDTQFEPQGGAIYAGVGAGPYRIKVAPGRGRPRKASTYDPIADLTAPTDGCDPEALPDVEYCELKVHGWPVPAHVSPRVYARCARLWWEVDTRRRGPHGWYMPVTHIGVDTVTLASYIAWCPVGVTVSKCAGAPRRDFTDIQLLLSARVEWGWQRFPDRPEHDRDRPVYDRRQKDLLHRLVDAGLFASVVCVSWAELVAAHPRVLDWYSFDPRGHEPPPGEGHREVWDERRGKFVKLWRPQPRLGWYFDRCFQVGSGMGNCGL